MVHVHDVTQELEESTSAVESPAASSSESSSDGLPKMSSDGYRNATIARKRRIDALRKSKQAAIAKKMKENKKLEQDSDDESYKEVK